MARLIVKSPYIKCGGGKSAGGYLKYIATRERVEIIPDDRPPTRKQEQLITKLVKDFPDTKTLLEYEDYTAHPTKTNASALIALALETNWDKLPSADGYAGYIALRPRAERLGEHGLFGDGDAVDLTAVTDELNHYTGNVWMHIISLHREDAERLGYDHADAWRTLLRTHRNDIAAAMKISPEDFHWYAAFHDEGNHPHVHMMAWSVKPNQAYLSKDGIRQIKSTLTNQIFRQELLHVYEQKSKSRDELVAETRKAMLELSKAMQEMTCDHPEAEQMIWDLSRQLGQVSGKKTYGYLPKPMKKLVDEIIGQMVRLPIVNECYQTWWELQCQVEDYYSEEKKRIRPPLSQQKEFRQIKNAVIKEAEHIRMNKISFEDADMQDDGEQVNTYDMSYECQKLQSIANNVDLTLEERDEAAEQLEQLADRRGESGANSADACPGCRDATLAPKAAHSGSQGRTRRLHLHLRSLCLFLVKLLGILAQAHAGLLLAERIHLPCQHLPLRRVELVVPVFLCAVRFAEAQLQCVAGSILRDVIVGVDVEPVIVFIRADEGAEGCIHIELRPHIKIELAVHLDDLITERKNPRGEVSRRGDFLTAQMVQQLAPLIIARREL